MSAVTHSHFHQKQPIPMNWKDVTGDRNSAQQDQTTMVVQQQLDRLADVSGDSAVHPIVRELIAGATNRLHILCSSMLFRSYPRLTRPPLNLEADELLSAVVERMLKAMKEFRPQGVRQFFAMANQHVRWELNDLARRLDREDRAQSIHESTVAAPDENKMSQETPNALRILEAIESLPTDEKDVFELVRIQGLSQPDAASVLGVSPKTIQRRLNRAIMLLSDQLADLLPHHGSNGSSGSGSFPVPAAVHSPLSPRPA
jgi:RNA polymerase sigma factor (sigma-70 family)